LKPLLNEVVPKITDFGLARRVDGSGLTQSGFAVGTPTYMAPEQASGNRAAGSAADIYSLGVLLYQLLTGQPPFRGTDPLEVLLAVSTVEPMPPRRLRPRIPRELEAITLKCLEKEPGRRYASAFALAEDLQRFRAGQPIAAHSPSTATRVVRWCRRKPLTAALLALLTGTFLVGFALVSWKWLEADEQRRLRGGSEIRLPVGHPNVPTGRRVRWSGRRHPLGRLQPGRHPHRRRQFRSDGAYLGGALGTVPRPQGPHG
jgi:hypothetical protein